MKNLLLLFLFIFLSCSQFEEPIIQERQQLEQSNSVEKNHYDFVGTYVTEDLQDGIEIFDNNSFAYKPNVNKQNNDYKTWRIGLWNNQDNIIFVKYKDGGECQLIPYNDKIIYFENDIVIEFLKATELNIVVGKNSSFDNR